MLLSTILASSMAVVGLAFTPFALILTALSRWAGGLVDRGGPRLPLVIGPAIAGAAFLFMAGSGLSEGPSRYWVTFFPDVVLLGIGMGITVAPLTTAVMGSVASHFARTAPIDIDSTALAGVFVERKFTAAA